MIRIKPALIKYSLKNIYKRKTRSWLTVISVLIGIASITALVSFGYGISEYTSSFAQQMGQDKLIMMARGISMLDTNVIMNKSDIDTIDRVNGVKEASGMYVVSAEIIYNKQKRYAMVAGIDYKNYGEFAEELMTVKILKGNRLAGTEKSKVILGYNYMIPDKIFTKPVDLGGKVNINGLDFEVLDFYGEIGNPSDDSNIYITDVAAEQIFNSKNYMEIFIRASPGVDTAALAEKITVDLRKERHQKEGTEDFFVQTFEQVIETFNSILNGIIAVVLLIALISVIVASVNIMNTMYASILERTREIGIFKAIGARNSEILLIFVMESGILSMIGGIIGLLIGMGIAKIAGIAISAAGYSAFKPFFSWQLSFGVLLFAFLVGIASGFVPAMQASKLKPVEALRYE
ncbi:MAG: ABC transporter permease [archaeon]